MRLTSKNYYTIGLFVLFAAILSSVYLTSYYNKSVAELNRRIFPTIEKGYFTLFSMQTPVDTKGIGVIAALRPGETYEGSVGIKSYDKTSRRTFRLAITPSENKSPDHTDLERSYVSFKTQDASIEPEGVAIIPFSIHIPNEAKPGKYEGVIAAKNVDNDSRKVKNGELILDVAQGINVNVTVGNDVTPYTYSDRSKQAKDIAKSLVINRVRYIAAFILLLMSGYLIYLHFASKAKISHS